MTQVSGSRDTTPAQRPTSRPQSSRPAQPDDVRAMSDAFAAARAKMKFEGTPAKQGKATLAKTMIEQGNRKPADAALTAAFDRKVAERQQSDRQADGQGIAPPSQPAPPPPVMIPLMPSPQANPGAFAQMLADLWTRENGKGAKEVRVKFGADAWPAIDALLVRNAAGALDISVRVAGGTGAAPLDGLDRHLSDAGLQIGAFAVLPFGLSA